MVVSYTDNPDMKTGKAFADIGVQIAAGVPLQVIDPVLGHFVQADLRIFQVDEGTSFSTFRIGLFGPEQLHLFIDSGCNFRTGLDKIGNIDATLRNITDAVNKAISLSITLLHPLSTNICSNLMRRAFI